MFMSTLTLPRALLGAQTCQSRGEQKPTLLEQAGRSQ